MQSRDAETWTMCPDGAIFVSSIRRSWDDLFSAHVRVCVSVHIVRVPSLQFDCLRNFRLKVEARSVREPRLGYFWVLLKCDAVDVSRARTAGFRHLDRAETPVKRGAVEFGNF